MEDELFFAEVVTNLAWATMTAAAAWCLFKSGILSMVMGKENKTIEEIIVITEASPRRLQLIRGSNIPRATIDLSRSRFTRQLSWNVSYHD